MKKVRKTLNILHSNLNSIDPALLTSESLYHMDEKTGEMTKIAEYYGADAINVINRIKKGINDKVSYSTLYQKSLQDLMSMLSPNQIKIILYFISKMGYENAVFGITYRKLSKELCMSLSSVTSSVNALIEHRLIIKYGSKQKKVYYVNPAIAWKGSRLNIRKKTGLFVESNFGKKPTAFSREKE